MSIVLFFVILAVLVLVHEFGHFFAAKRFGVRVDEFGLGFPPRIWGKKVGETLYSINAIPFGGFVKIFGENPDADSIDGPHKGRSFVNIAKWKQVVVLASGVLMNILFAWLLFSVAYLSGMTTIVTGTDNKYVQDSHVIILGILPNSPALKAGLKSGDQVRTLFAAGATTSVPTVEFIQAAVRASKGAEMTFGIDRDGTDLSVTAIPEMGSSDVYAIGISMDQAGKVVLPLHLAIWEGGRLTIDMFTGIATNLYTLAHDAVLGRADFSQVSGPVGIARLVGDAGKLGIVYLLSFTAFISLNLAALNLVPFPALDGGRILFVIIEAIKRSPIRPAVANMTNAVGFGILILLMLFVTYRDILKIFR
ncbi:MAG: site-2 protease family protein [Candidatus Paceibacterota bacterium]|jgi:regulator of sigma E protease